VLDGASYRTVRALAGDERFAPDSFPGLAIDLRTLWTLPE
jgi:hypothetical protein